jgi:hypothetical protein
MGRILLSSSLLLTDVIASGLSISPYEGGMRMYGALALALVGAVPMINALADKILTGGQSLDGQDAADFLERS